VIHRLIKVDHILLLLKKSKDKSKRMLKVHPNFTGEDVTSAHALEDIDVVTADQAIHADDGSKDPQRAQEAMEDEPAEEEEKAPSTPQPRRTSSKTSTPARTPSSGRSGRSARQ
jgi:hypothetical protein